ncbi:MAG TPA: 3-phosphoshikimate 1-carboxyvinyltransferase [Nitrosomonas sp.]|nr:3-phosphoshikimate 1-carboxyvinyltransferase [Nitrosomonas sp.]HQX13582.1 3-phosphoshikimate 1-carboxyvinyltransferase [Nitrosomonas sp.]HRB32968.1 3-phosphoshikimate 1-carboxyvinyltransferase [Nitrosomonas sp.]HRB45629.1 3-phosphoshikimate 1-carboxyvinyltransferase [Nitrosomonas sp.]HRB77634.1 3-phosphoshikimate 1-carboxyvinyltransferase [Nitrosomonas sp.]
MNWLDLPLTKYARGNIRLPGSKSISNRILLLAALSSGETDIHDLLASDDTTRMLEALNQLGVPIAQIGEHDYRITGQNGKFPVTSADLFLGNAGTAFRPLAAVLSLMNGQYRLSGVPRMHERPIGDLVDALRQLGATLSYLGHEGFPPLHIEPFTPHNEQSINKVTVKGNASSQFLTGLLIALPLTQKESIIHVAGELISKPYVDLTIAQLQHFGVQVENQNWQSFRIPASQIYRSPGSLSVEGDASSASYFLAAGAIGGGPVRVYGVGRDSAQGDVHFTKALEMMGTTITMGENWIEASNPTSKNNEKKPLHAIDLDCNHIPDAAMTLAVCALFANGSTTLRNIASWRVKETDRLAAMSCELRKLGAVVDEGADYLHIIPPVDLSANASIDTYDDHRMAMCFSLACFGAAVRINDPNCVSKTFPDYFKAFNQITQSQ